MFRCYKRPVHTTSRNALAINRYFRPLRYFRPVKTTTSIYKHPVGIRNEPSELQTTSSQQTPTKDVQLDVEMPTYRQMNNGWIH